MPRSAPLVTVSAALLALSLSLSACTGDSGAHGAAPGSFGSPGLRDPYFPKLGNGGYDVTHYALTLDYDPNGHRLRGTAVITARAAHDLRAFNLDLKGLDVEDVTVEGEGARWSRAGQELTVRPEDEVDKGERFRTTVRYAGAPEAITDPDGSEEGWLRTRDGALALGEPTGSMAWFPGNHHPSDKASYDITVTVPEGLHAVSNGEPGKEPVPTRKGRTTYSWRAAEPMASYVATVAIGRYGIQRSKTRDGLPVYVAVDPSQAKQSRKVLARIPEVMAWSEGVFGPYPFSSTGAIVDRPEDSGYALETQNRPTFPGAPDIDLLVHELAHQWYGNSVTPRSWRDMWLNEGFATYAEWLWQEEHGGDSAQKTFDALYRGTYYPDLTDDRAIWAFPPAEPPDAAHISDSPVYQRGAMVLHKVRRTIGDTAFRTLLRGWATEHRHGNADTGDFTEYAEKHAQKHAPGKDLSDVWKEWLYGDGKPARP
ncbi:M1 family metallopeptidase [Streptomyces phyllanthi]